jgi:hypothetical protein
MNIIMMGMMAIIHALGMYVGFIKLLNKFEPSTVNAIEQHVQRRNQIHRACKITKIKPQINKIYPIRTDIKSTRIVRFKEYI